MAYSSVSTTARSLNPLNLEMPVQYIRGIGPRRSEQLAAAGIHTVADLIDYPPFRYEDRSFYRPLDSLQEGEWILTRGNICSLGGLGTRKRRMTILEMLVKDRTGS